MAATTAVVLCQPSSRQTGFAASLEFRQMLASHTDTYASGPMTAAELVAAASK